MFKNQLLIFFRNLRKSSLVSTINILGLAVGMAACILIFNYVQFETSYDRFFSKHDTVFRLIWKYGTDQYTTRLQPLVGEVAPKQVNHINSSVRFFSQEGTVNLNDHPEVAFWEEEIIYADHTLFELFDFEIAIGERSSFLQSYSAILSFETAQKYFGNENPVGKAIMISNMFGQVEYVVRAVVKKIPPNSSFRFNLLLSNERLFSPEMAHMGINTWGAFDTYILLDDDKNASNVAHSFKELVKQYQPNEENELLLQPLSEMHLYSGFIYGSQDGIVKVYVFSAIAVIILVLAWFNYVNLSMSKAIERAKEVGIKKIFGSGKKQILVQFLNETLLTNFISFVLAILSSQVFSDALSAFTGIELSMLTNWGLGFVLVFSTMLILGSIVSGLIPGMVMTKFKTLSIVSGKMKYSDKGRLLKRTLVGFQFGITAVLILMTLTIHRQINFMINSNKGLKVDDILIVEAPKNNQDNYMVRLESFTNGLKQNAWFNGLTVSSVVPGVGYNYGTNARKPDASDGEQIEIKVAQVDAGYVTHYDITLLAGANFNEKVSNSSKVLLNEAAVEKLGFLTNENAIGKNVFIGGSMVEILGIVKNYNHNSLHEPFYPTAFAFAELGNNFSIQVDKKDHAQIIEYLEEEFKAYFPGNPFVYYYLEDVFTNHYLTDRQTANLGMIFTCLAIAIACLGLFGFTSLTTLQKTKEIGIRKVLGASAMTIFFKLSFEFIILIVLASMLCIPVGIYFSDLWLEEFSFHFVPGVVHFTLPLFLLVLVALFALSFHTVKAARANPVEALRYE